MIQHIKRSTRSLTFSIESSKSPVTDKSTQFTTSFSEGYEQTNNGDLTKKISVTIDQTAHIPKQKFSSLRLERRTRCNLWIKRWKLCNWIAMKERLGFFLIRCLQAVDLLNQIAIFFVKQKLLHGLRQCGIVFVLMCLFRFTGLYDTDSNKVVLPYLTTISLAVYMIIQNVYFFFLHGKLKVEKCLKDYSEAQQIMGIFYTFLSIIANALLLSLSYCTFQLTFSSSTTLAMIFGIIGIFQVITDGHVLHLLCPAVFLLSLAILMVAFASYSMAYFVCHIFCKQFQSRNDKATEAAKKNAINGIVAQVAFPYCCTSDHLECVVCLQTIKQDESAVFLDCSQSHVFHSFCMSEWLCRANMCPMCRAPVIPEEMYTFD